MYVAEEGLAAPQGSWAKAFPKDGDFRSAFRYALFLGKASCCDPSWVGLWRRVTCSGR